MLISEDGGRNVLDERPIPAGPDGGRAELDCEAILAAVDAALDAALARARPDLIALSSAMHTLIALDEADRPLTTCSTWADGRARDQAERLHAEGVAAELHARTGAPIHAGSPLAKILWLRERRPEIFARARRLVSVKELLLRRACGSPLVDHAVAAASGMARLHAPAWDERALHVAGLEHDRLGEIASPLHVVDPGVRGLPTLLGASDGVLANLGLDAMRPGVLAASLGTSGAVRAGLAEPRLDPRARLFCYPLLEDAYVLGGAVNAGGMVLQWLARTVLGASADTAATPETLAALLELAAGAPAGADGLVAVPFLTAERYARFPSRPHGILHGLRSDHGREHIARAMLEGILVTLRVVLRDVEALAGRAREVRLAGGWTRSSFVRQLAADVFDRPIAGASTEQASCLGAAALAWRALGKPTPPLPVRSGEHRPRADVAALYERLAAEHRRLLAAL